MPPKISNTCLRRVVETAFAQGVPKATAKKWVEELNKEVSVQDDASFELHFLERQTMWTRTENRRKRAQKMREKAAADGVELPPKRRRKRNDDDGDGDQRDLAGEDSLKAELKTHHFLVQSLVAKARKQLQQMSSGGSSSSSGAGLTGDSSNGEVSFDKNDGEAFPKKTSGFSASNNQSSSSSSFDAVPSSSNPSVRSPPFQQKNVSAPPGGKPKSPFAPRQPRRGPAGPAGRGGVETTFPPTPPSGPRAPPPDGAASFPPAARSSAAIGASGEPPGATPSAAPKATPLTESSTPKESAPPLNMTTAPVLNTKDEQKAISITNPNRWITQKVLIDLLLDKRFQKMYTAKVFMHYLFVDLPEYPVKLPLPVTTAKEVRRLLHPDKCTSFVEAKAAFQKFQQLFPT